MAWKGEAEECSISHKAICPLLKQFRQVVKGKATGGVGGAAGGDGGVPEGGGVGGARGQRGKLTHGMKAHVHARVLRRMTRGGSRGEKDSDLTSAPVDIDAGWEEVCLARKTKALEALHDAGAKFLWRRLLTETRQLTHSMTSALEVAVDRA